MTSYFECRSESINDLSIEEQLTLAHGEHLQQYHTVEMRGYTLCSQSCIKSLGSRLTFLAMLCCSLCDSSVRRLCCCDRYSIFSLLAVLATIVNVLILASTKMYHSVGFCGPETEQKLLCAIVIEHVLITIKCLAADMIDDEPADLQDNVLRLERKIAK